MVLMKIVCVGGTINSDLCDQPFRSFLCCNTC